MRHLFRVTLLSLLIIAVLLAGCGTNNAEPATEPEQAAAVTIGLLIPSSEAFFTDLANGAAEAATRLGATLQTAEAAENAETQQSQLQEMVDQKVQAIIIIPVDTEAIVPALEEASAAGVAIFTVDRSANTDVVIAHIASDNVAGGGMAADYLAEAIEGQGSVVELTGIGGTSAAQDRGSGFNNAILAYPDIEIVSKETANFNRAEGQEVFAAILTAHSTIDAVFAHNDEMILGAIAAAQEAGRADEIVFVGFDAVAEAVTALESGDLDATIAQQPAEMGRLGVETAVQYLQGESVPEFIPVELSLITK